MEPVRERVPDLKVEIVRVREPPRDRLPCRMVESCFETEPATVREPDNAT
jgi:hypothetical protein